ncbi:MAG: hypothetical protein AAF327_13235 [Cyanobacteria bacterium P01_A01_bin.37]
MPNPAKYDIDRETPTCTINRSSKARLGGIKGGLPSPFFHHAVGCAYLKVWHIDH